MVGPIRPSAIPSAAFSEPAAEGPLDPPEEEASPLGMERPLDWYATKLASEAACLLPCNQALGLAKLEMLDGGLGEEMLDHFRSGQATPVHVDLDREFARNPQLRELVTSQVELQIALRWESGERLETMSGAVWVSQGDYGPSEAGRDQQYALGGTYFEWDLVGSDAKGGLLARLNVSDHYFWSPSEERATQCLHACGAALVRERRATEFHQFGEGHLTVIHPGSESPMLTPDVESEGLR